MKDYYVASKQGEMVFLDSKAKADKLDMNNGGEYIVIDAVPRTILSFIFRPINIANKVEMRIIK